MTDVSPRHRAVKHRAPRARPRYTSRHALAAAAIGGVLVTGGVVGAQALGGSSTAPADAAAGEVPVASRLTVDGDVSRSADRAPLSAVEEAAEIARSSAEKADQDEADQAAAEKKKAAEQQKKDDAAAAEKQKIEEARSNPKAVARQLMPEYGFDASQFSCLDSLWAGESDWDYTATNPSSGAYGIPQSLPATKMATAGDDWQTNPITQIRWGLQYISEAYGTPCAANTFKAGNNFY
ncbi:lytic transglycosylase domain-containing protein [Aeromicrobium sp. CF3.5]|uniref:aggregation-promoting factor C-terminal-like domain-containing protein n=1 Tax=Aeromicrobium sp. CF3.5 TaxID=3373078 RepID=UPI003EE46596